MNKKKLTLLIALSTIIIIIIISITSLSSITEVKSEIVVKEEAKIIIENSIVKEEIKIEEPQLKEEEKEIIIEYPEAQLAWDTMISFGWSPEVCAGILGNIMRECGGDTFKLKWSINGGHGFGLCQWTSSRKQTIFKYYNTKTPSIGQQIEFIQNELTGENGIRRQVSERQYNKLMNSSSPEQAAKYFAAYYERPASSNYSRRQTNAKKAYQYFTAIQ